MAMLCRIAVRRGLVFLVSLAIFCPIPLREISAQESAGASPGNVRPFSIEQILGSPFPSSLVAARSGSRIAWVFERQGRRSIQVAEGPEFVARSILEFPDDDGQLLAIEGFSADSEMLVFRRGGSRNPAQIAEGPTKPSLWRIGFTGGEPALLAEAGNVQVSPKDNRIAWAKENSVFVAAMDEGATPQKVFEVKGEISQLHWSPDGQQILLQIDRASFGEKYSFIACLNLASSSLKYLDPSTYQDSSPRWSPDGGRVAFLRRLTEGTPGTLHAKDVTVDDPWTIQVVEIESGKPVTVLRSPEQFSFSQAGLEWLDDTTLVFRSERDGWSRLYLVSAAGGNPRAISPSGSEVESFSVDSGGRVLVTSNAGDIDRRHLWTYEGGRQIRQLTSGQGNEWSPVRTGDGQHIAYLGSDARYPAHPHVRSVNSEEAIRLAPEALPAGFPADQLVEPEQVIVQSADGTPVHCQLFAPPSEFSGRRPAVLYFHGGPMRQMLLGWHYSAYYHNAYAINQYLVSRGYVVLSVNYRLGTGYGRDFRDAAEGGPRGASEYQDLVAAAKYLRDLPGVDPDRIGLWGGSYGGYLTALGLARNSDWFAAGVDLHGVHDWNQWQAWSKKRPVEEDPVARKASPIADIDSWRSPVLLVHGDDDANVPYSETIRLARELRKHGVEYEQLILPDEVHSFLRHDSWTRVARATTDFFDRKLRDLASRNVPVEPGARKYVFDLDGTRLNVFTYKPANYDGTRMIVVMHGVLRNADEYRDHAIAMGERFGALIVAPEFDDRRFPSRRYQYGGVLDGSRNAAPESEWTYPYLAKLASFVRDMEDRPEMPFTVIGHSAGGQFVVRMAAFFDPGATRLVAANPGSDLFPTHDMDFGYGFGGLPPELSDEAALRRYLKAPLTIYLGTADNKPDDNFDSSETAMKQGAGRFQRGTACYEMAKRVAEEKGWEFNWTIVLAEGVDHDHEKMFNHENCERALYGK